MSRTTPSTGAAPGPGSPLGPAERLPYEMGGVLGRGGMGEVRSAYDPRLGRDVAIKTVYPGDAIAAGRLAREAAITARLEHPAIMPIYAAGVDPNGRPWYAMRRFEGRSLADRLAAANDLPARLRLVRHVLEVSEAIAYAHSQGVLHRDLKPANVMTGHFGETLVADWGLACSFEEAATGGGPAGTPGYMSPEQLTGAPVDVRSDVYGLGAMLHELLAGGPPGPPHRTPLPPDAPPELAAIARRALETSPDRRYPTARAFADDLLAWFEGRRVSALEYRAADSLRLLLRAWRVPIRVAGVALSIFGLAIGASSWRTAAERARAEESERVAVQARADEAVAFAAALRGQAAAGLAAGLTLEPRVLAAESLARHEDADGRGVLAAVYDRHLLELVRPPVPVPECSRRAMSTDGARAACATGSELLMLDGATGAVLDRAPSAAIRLAFAAPDALVALDVEGGIWSWRPPAAPIDLRAPTARAGEIGDTLTLGRVGVTRDTTEVVVDTTTGTATESRTCVDAVVKATAIDRAGRLLVGCHDGRIVRTDAAGSVDLLRVAASDGVPYRLVPTTDGRIFVGTYSGTGLVYSSDGALLARRSLGSDGVWSADWSGDSVMVTLADGTAVLWNTVTDTLRARLAVDYTTFAWTRDGKLRQFGASLADRDAGAPARLNEVPLGSGITAVTWAPDGRHVGASLGSGHVKLVDPERGVVDATLVGEAGVAKDVAFSADGAEVLVARVGMEATRYDRSGHMLARARPAGARRVAWFKDLGAVFIGYGPRHFIWPRGGPITTVVGRGFTDIEVDRDGRRGVALSPDDSLWFVTAEAGKLQWRWARRFGMTTTVASLGDTALVGEMDGIVEVAPDGTIRWRLPLDITPCALGVDPSRTLIAVGFLDGTVGVYRRGGSAPIARLRGHRARLGGVAFSADGRWLATGAWDGGLRLWSVEAFTVAVDPTIADLTAATGVPLDAALRVLSRSP